MSRSSSGSSDENVRVNRKSSLGSSRIIQGRYRLGRTLETTWGTKVKVCKDIATNESVILKCVKFQEHTQAPRDRLLREVEFLRSYSSRHANIIGFREFIPIVTYTKLSSSGEETTSAPSLHDASMAVLVMELADKQDLLSLVRDCGPVPEDAARTLFSQLTDVLSFLHTSNVCHLDIRPENLLIDANFQLKVSGFGRSASTEPITHPEGSLPVMAPEVFSSNSTKPYDGMKADIWSAAVCLFIMLFGRLPFSMTCSADCCFRLLLKDSDAYWNAIKNGDNTNISPAAIAILQQTLNPAPFKRPSIGDIMEDVWLREDAICDMASYMETWLSTKS